MNDFKKIINLYLLGRGEIKNPYLAKYQPFIIPSLSLVICLLLVFLITIPQFLSLYNSFKTLDEVNAKSIQVKEKISQLEHIDPNLYKENLKTALIALPAEKDIPGIIDQVLILVSSAGLRLEGMNFSATSDAASPITNYSIKIELTGDISQIKTFISKAKNSPRIIKMNTIEFSSSLQSNNRIRATFSLLTFYQNLPANVQTDNFSVPLLTEADLKVLSAIKENVQTIPVLSPQDLSSVKTGKPDPFQ